MLQRTIKAVIRAGEQSGYTAECVEVPVVTQGHNLDEVTRNLRALRGAARRPGRGHGGAGARFRSHDHRHDGVDAGACLDSDAFPARRSSIFSVVSGSSYTPNGEVTPSCVASSPTGSYRRSRCPFTPSSIRERVERSCAKLHGSSPKRSCANTSIRNDDFRRVADGAAPVRGVPSPRHRAPRVSWRDGWVRGYGILGA